MKINVYNDARAEDLAVANASHPPARPPCRPHDWQGSGVQPRGGPAAEPPLFEGFRRREAPLAEPTQRGGEHSPRPPHDPRRAPPSAHAHPLPAHACPLLSPLSPLISLLFGRRRALETVDSLAAARGAASPNPALSRPAITTPPTHHFPLRRHAPPWPPPPPLRPRSVRSPLCLSAQSPLRKSLEAEMGGPAAHPPRRRPAHAPPLAGGSCTTPTLPPPQALTPPSPSISPPHNPIPHPHCGSRHLTVPGQMCMTVCRWFALCLPPRNAWRGP